MLGTKPRPVVDANSAQPKPVGRKRRTVLWLYNEDYEFLAAVS